MKNCGCETTKRKEYNKKKRKEALNSCFIEIVEASIIFTFFFLFLYLSMFNFFKINISFLQTPPPGDVRKSKVR